MDQNRDSGLGTSGTVSWATVLTISAAVLVPLITAWMGYQSGAASVNKDYTALAIEIVKDKNSPPETRKWAVTVLDKLSPIPFTDKAKRELSVGVGSTFIFAQLGLSQTAMAERCAPLPSLKDGTSGTIDLYMVTLISLYAECAGSKRSLVDLLAKFEENDRAKMRELGIPEPSSANKAPPAP